MCRTLDMGSGEVFRLRRALLSKGCFPRTLTKLDWPFRKTALRYEWQECTNCGDVAAHPDHSRLSTPLRTIEVMQRYS
jgi:hypothetical protein